MDYPRLHGPRQVPHINSQHKHSKNSWNGGLVGLCGGGDQAPRARRHRNNDRTSSKHITKAYLLTTQRPHTTGCELTIYEPISSFLTDAHVYILAAHHNHQACAEAAAAATQTRAAEILDCLTDTEIPTDDDQEILFDETHEALSHLESLIAAARLACEWEEAAAAAAAAGQGAGTTAHNPAGPLRAAVAAACDTLAPLLAELPALWAAVAADARFAAFWEGPEGARRAAAELPPDVRERMRWVVESCEM